MSEAAHLTLAQWLSPAFPVGAFAYSHGLEAAIAAGAVADAPTLQAWVADVVAHGSGRNDAILLCHAMAGAEGLDDLARALAGSAGRWTETHDQGHAFAAAVTQAGVAVAPAPYPLAVGRAARALDACARTVAGHYLLSVAGALISAGQRALPLGQVQAQATLAALHPVIRRVAAEAAAAPLDALGGSVFAGDLDAIAHETLQPRMFRT